MCEEECRIQDNTMKLVSGKKLDKLLEVKEIELLKKLKKKEKLFNEFGKFNESDEICKHLFQFRIIAEHNYSLAFKFYRNNLFRLKNKFKVNC